MIEPSDNPSSLTYSLSPDVEARLRERLAPLSAILGERANVIVTPDTLSLVVQDEHIEAHFGVTEADGRDKDISCHVWSPSQTLAAQVAYLVVTAARGKALEAPSCGDGDDFEDQWQNFWKPLLQSDEAGANAGEWDETSIKNEIHDFARVLEQVPRVYCHITNGNLSYPTYESGIVISCAADVQQREFHKWYRDEAAPLVAALRRAREEISFTLAAYPHRRHGAGGEALRQCDEALLAFDQKAPQEN